MSNKKPLFVIILLYLVAVDVSRASFLDNFRKLLAQAPTESISRTGSPIPSPVPGVSQLSSNKSEDKPQVTPPAGKGKEGKEDNPSLTPKDNPTVIPPASKGKEEKKDDAKGDERTNETCDGADRFCKDSKSMVACVKEVDNAANILVLLIQNKNNRKVTVDIRTLSANEVKQVEVAKDTAEKVNISSKAFTTQIILNAGDGDCVLQMSSPQVSSPTTAYRDFIDRLPSYRRFVTPIYGACLFLGMILIAGGVFGFCKLRKRRKQAGEIPYQELEMGGTGTGVIVESADGWDQGWDDDWDDEKAVRSPGALRRSGSISANGLTTRSPKKEAWENWDD